MKRFITLLLALCLLISPVVSSAAYNIPYEGVLDNPGLKEMIKKASRQDWILYPPEEHPYILLNQNYIEQLKANKDSDVYKQAYSQQLTIAKRELPAQPKDGILDSQISTQLNARAFMYAMGEVDKAHAQDTIKYAIEYIANAKTIKTGAIDIYKDFGNNAILTGSYVYDWCHSAMTSAQKSELAKLVRDLLYSPQQPCRPDNVLTDAWQDINGKAVGDPLFYMAVGVSAVCDAYPEMYTAVMGRIQGTMAKAAKIYGEAGALTDGSINYSREDETYKVEVLLQRMGHDTTELYGYNLRAGYMMLYSRLPFGIFIKYGDNSPPPNYVYGTYRNTVDIQDNMGLLSVKYEDPYLKHYYMRENSSSGALEPMLMKKSWHEAKTPDDLPLVLETFSPRSAIVAKTSWQEGLDSPQVSAYLNMNNRRSGDHDHADHGTFQIYYKGPLSIPGGTYYGQDWGKTHWKNYFTRTISKNGMLIYEPGEVYVYGRASAADANDGGQLGAGAGPGFGSGAGYVIDQFEDHFSDRNLKTDTIGTYIGPNEMTPAFSYIKGDLTDAYASSKMDNFQRSMVFMDTFNETYPGMLIVFDHIVSKNSSFKKTFLLQAVAEPKINGNKVTIVNSESNPLANGKLVNVSLLPEKVNIEKVGGIGIYVADGKEWPVDSEDSNGGATIPVDTMYASGWRAEISPQTEKKEDIFLNAMFVADADTTAPDLEMTKVEDGDMVGVVALDRQVMFKKDGKSISKEFTVNVKDNNNGGKMLVLLTDVAEGIWKVTGSDYSAIIESKEYDNAFVFEAKPGKYTISPAGEDAKVSEFTWPQAEKEKIGDFSIKVGNVYQYLRQPTKIVNGVPYITESFVEYSTECSQTREGNSLIITVPNGTKLKLTAGSNKCERIVNGVSQMLDIDNAPFIDNDIFYFSYLNGVGTTMGMNCVYYEVAKSLTVTIRSFADADETVLEGVDESKVLWPVTVYSSTDDGNVAANVLDRDLATRWSSLAGDGEWLTFEMGEEPVKMSGVQIAFYNGDKRNWKFDIEISNDGENWTKVLSNKSAGQSKNPETFNFGEPVSAKFIRYVGHGEEVTNSLNNSLTEFIVINK